MPAKMVYMWFGINPGGGPKAYRYITSYGWADNQAVVWSVIGWPDTSMGTEGAALVVDQGGVWRAGTEGPLGRSVGVTNIHPRAWAVAEVHALYDTVTSS
ncbi:hypothetical protein [Streptomyces sp. NPDC056883]|uniref:hypothetical protein n=1 Tax=Streptomyces sp. NPDC056883 TaxID=3345959 RepID=UPI0036C0C05F